MVAHVQSATGGTDNTTLTPSVKFPAPVGIGNTVIAFVGDAQTLIQSVTDDKGNIYTALPEDSFHNNSVFIYYCINVRNAPQTIIVNERADGFFPFMIIDEFSGVVAFDATGVEQTSFASATLATGTIVPISDGELLYTAAWSFDSTIQTVNAPFTLSQIDPNNIRGAGYYVQPTAEALNAEWVPASSGTGFARIAAFTAKSGVTATNLVASYALPGSRNNYSGAVGVSFMPDEQLTFNEIGTLCGSGVLGPRTIALRSTDRDIELARVTIDLTGATTGQWVWADIPTVTLAAGETFAVWGEVVSDDGYFWSDANPDNYVLRNCSAWNSAYSDSLTGDLNIGAPESQFWGFDLNYIAAQPPSISGTLSVTEVNDTLAAIGKLTIGGALAVPQAPDTLSAAGNVVAFGVISAGLHIVQAAQGFAAHGTVLVSGALNQIQADQKLGPPPARMPNSVYSVTAKRVPPIADIVGRQAPSANYGTIT